MRQSMKLLQMDRIDLVEGRNPSTGGAAEKRSISAWVASSARS
jgi:hypothetical protein